MAPHVEWVENGLYEFLPGLSRGSGEPAAAARLEYTRVDLVPSAGAARAFEAALGAARDKLQSETLWFRLVAGGPTPRYVRLRPRRSLSAVLIRSGEEPLPEPARRLVERTSVEIWSLRPTMSLGVGPPR